MLDRLRLPGNSVVIALPAALFRSADVNQGLPKERSVSNEK